MKIAKVRLSDQVANEIQSMIMNGEFQPGDQLPVENELAQLFAVSRITVREAIGKLSLTGLIDVKQGEGTFVKALAPESFMRPLLPMLMMSKKDIQDVFAVRLLIECKTAELAAQNATEADLAQVSKCLKLMDDCALAGDTDGYNEHDVQFHYLVAKCSHNQVLITIQKVLMDMVKRAIELATQPPNALTVSILYHRRIFDALSEKNGSAASEAMQKHIEGGAGYIDTGL